MTFPCISILRRSLNYAELDMNYASEGPLIDFANARESSSRDLCEACAGVCEGIIDSCLLTIAEQVYGTRALAASLHRLLRGFD